MESVVGNRGIRVLRPGVLGVLLAINHARSKEEMTNDGSEVLELYFIVSL